MWDKGKAAVIWQEATVTSDAGVDLWTTRSSIFVRGEGGFGGDRGTSEPVALPDREPDADTTYAITPQQALLYRLCGDRNPLHSDPAFAEAAGFPAPILHGLCSYGITLRELTTALLDSDATRVSGLRGQVHRRGLPRRDAAGARLARGRPGRRRGHRGRRRAGRLARARRRGARPGLRAATGWQWPHRVMPGVGARSHSGCVRGPTTPTSSEALVIDQTRVQSGFDAEVLLGSRYLQHLLLLAIDVGVIPSSVEVAGETVRLMQPHDADRTYDAGRRRRGAGDQQRRHAALRGGARAR